MLFNRLYIAIIRLLCAPTALPRQVTCSWRALWNFPGTPSSLDLNVCWCRIWEGEMGRSVNSASDHLHQKSKSRIRVYARHILVIYVHILTSDWAERYHTHPLIKVSNRCPFPWCKPVYKRALVSMTREAHKSSATTESLQAVDASLCTPLECIIHFLRSQTNWILKSVTVLNFKFT